MCSIDLHRGRFAVKHVKKPFSNQICLISDNQINYYVLRNFYLNFLWGNFWDDSCDKVGNSKSSLQNGFMHQNSIMCNELFDVDLI